MQKISLLIIFLVICTSFALAEDSFGEKITGSDYELSRSKISRSITFGNIFQDSISIKNLGVSEKEVTFTVSSELSDVVEFTEVGAIVAPNNETIINFLIKGVVEGDHTGTISLSGGLVAELPVNISVVNYSLEPSFLIESNLIKNKLALNRPLELKIDVTFLKPTTTAKQLNFSFVLEDLTGKEYILGSESLEISSSVQLIKKINFPADLVEGDYILNLYSFEEETGYSSKSKNAVYAQTPFFSRKLFGFIPMWLAVGVGSTLFLGLIIFFLVKRNLDSKKKYKGKLDKKSLAKKDNKNFFFGQIAENDYNVYFEPNRFATHCIVAGATGGGKSIAAQVIVEEALMKNIAVIVFDPTAQWSGMLRKCEDKRMTSLYPKFGLKPTDARGFPGNIRQVKDARQILEIEKYIHPGQIQVFSLNKLDTKDMDTFVANVIRQIFRSDPKESPDIKVMLVFDEVHRLLPKFGGSGEGFLQIERACREFRKWGLGVLLISQVLSDFVGEIKANINTEIQMRTRDEGDLNRIKIKYGEDFLKSLVKASIGAGMVVNPTYNHASPFFVQFRPILHNTRRLPDEELDKYNAYNDVIDDLEYQAEQLEKEKVDTFDLKMELKLVKDKMMSGNFSVVDIYLEGLKPRLAKQWEKIGKTPQKKQIQLADLDEIKKSVEEAKKQRDKIQKEEASKVEAQAKQQEVLEEKIIEPLTFDNGLMVSSLKELKGVLSTLDDEIFKIHVNEKKNDIADFVAKLFPDQKDKLTPIISKEELSKAIAPLGAKENPK